MRRTSTAAVVLGSWLLVASGAAAQARAFAVDEGKLQFVSDATLEKITGSSTALSGELSVDPADLKNARGTVKTKVASLGTGLELRDEHLHGESWLDAEHFPEATIELESVQGADKLKADEVVTATLKAKLTLHGVTREIVAEAKVRFSPGSAPGQKSALHVVSSFTIHLEDYGVSVPSIVALKVAPDIRVNVDLHASAT
jgi:polyisoprenoid-binding protein YceI